MAASSHFLPVSRAALLAAVLALNGCVSTLAFDPAATSDRAAVNERAGQSGAVPLLALDGDRGRRVRDLDIRQDSTTWVDASTGEAHSVPTDRVATVTFRRDGAGALKGVAIGVAVGAAFGALAARTPNGDAFLTVSPALAAALGAANGVWVGALVGAVVSDRHIYRTDLSRTANEVAGAARAACRPPLACAVPHL